MLQTCKSLVKALLQAALVLVLLAQAGRDHVIRATQRWQALKLPCLLQGPVRILFRAIVDFLGATDFILLSVHAAVLWTAYHRAQRPLGLLLLRRSDLANFKFKSGLKFAQ
jgi:hypothetical protein